MLTEKKVAFNAPNFADACKRSSRHSSSDVEFEEFEQELLAAIETEAFTAKQETQE